MDGVDCYGLVYLFYKRELNIELPELSIYAHLKDPIIHDLVVSQEARWSIVDMWQPGTTDKQKSSSDYLDYWQGLSRLGIGDILLYRVRDPIKGTTWPHIGIHVGGGIMLHQLEGALSSLIDLHVDLVWSPMPRRPMRMTASGQLTAGSGRFVNAYRYTYLSR